MDITLVFGDCFRSIGAYYWGWKSDYINPLKSTQKSMYYYRSNHMCILATNLACVSHAIRSGMQREKPLWDLNPEPCHTFLSEWCYSLSIPLLMNFNTSTVLALFKGLLQFFFVWLRKWFFFLLKKQIRSPTGNQTLNPVSLFCIGMFVEPLYAAPYEWETGANFLKI